MTESEFWMFLGRIGSREENGEEFVEIVNGMIGMLDSSDMDDYFGTEGWRHEFGWNE